MAFTTEWNATNELQPTAASSPAQGDNQIRGLKVNVRERVGVEHRFSTETDNLSRQGIHRAGSAIPFITASAPPFRIDGSDFEADYDEGRMWIDTGHSGRLMYLSEVDEDGVPTWTPLLTESIAKIQAFATFPPVADRWLLCDGRLLTSAEDSADGSTEGYTALITALHAEAAGNVDHPYYANSAGTSAYIPDLRGRAIRGIEDGTNSADKDGRGTELNDADGLRSSGGYQESAILDHDHLMDHSHGASVVDGHDSGAGRTGDPTSWSDGSPNFDEDEKATWFATDAQLTSTGTLTMRDPSNTVDAGGFKTGADNDNVNVDLNHFHATPRHYGLTQLTSIQDADTTHGVPEREFNTATDDNIMANVALYYYIKY